MKYLIILYAFLIGCATVRPGDKGFYLYDSFEKSFKNDKLTSLTIRINNQKINHNDYYMELFLNSLTQNLSENGIAVNNPKIESQLHLNLNWSLDNNYQKDVGTKFLTNRKRIQYTLGISMLDTTLILKTMNDEKPMFHIGEKFYSKTNRKDEESYQVESPESVLKRAGLFYSHVITALFTPANEVEGKWRLISDGSTLEFKRINNTTLEAKEEPTIGSGKLELLSKDYWSQNTYQINENFLIKGNAKIYNGARLHLFKNTRTNASSSSNREIKIINIGNLFVIIPSDYFEHKITSYAHFYIKE